MSKPTTPYAAMTSDQVTHALNTHPGLHCFFGDVTTTRGEMATMESNEAMAKARADTTGATAVNMAARRYRLEVVRQKLASGDASREAQLLAIARHGAARAAELQVQAESRTSCTVWRKAQAKRAESTRAYTNAKARLTAALEDQERAVEEDPGMSTPCDRAALLESLAAAELQAQGT